MSINTTTAPEETRVPLQRTSKGRIVFRRFMRHKQAVAGVFIILLLVAYAVFGPMISQWDYDELDFLNIKSPPSAEHWLGTDVVGGDLFVLAAHGLGRSLMIGFIASICITIIAAFVGTSIAYFEGWPERIGTWILDMLLVVPSFLLLAIIVKAASGTNGWIWLTAGLVAFGWIAFARIVRSLALSVREREYIKAAKFMGVRPMTIIRRHMIPNLGSILIIHTILGVAIAIEAETGLSFLGFGITPPDTSLGVLIKNGASTMETAPWILLIPAILLLLLTYSLTKIGDGLRDALDPSSNAGGRA